MIAYPNEYHTTLKVFSYCFSLSLFLLCNIRILFQINAVMAYGLSLRILTERPPSEIVFIHSGIMCWATSVDRDKSPSACSGLYTIAFYDDPS